MVAAFRWKLPARLAEGRFYHKLFGEKKSPLVALREAQLAIYHHPEHRGLNNLPI